MLRCDNYQNLIEKYQTIIGLIKDQNISKDEFVEHVNNNTPIGQRVISFLSALKHEDEDIKNLLKELMWLIYD